LKAIGWGDAPASCGEAFKVWEEAREQRDKLAEALEYIIGIGYTTKTEAKAKKALNQLEP
jgi:hypothetical protein